jgi:hypothetical protein
MIFRIPHPSWVCDCAFLFTHVTVSLVFPLDALDITLPLLSGAFGNLWTFKAAGVLDVTDGGTKTWSSNCWYASLMNLGVYGLKGRRPSY